MNGRIIIKTINRRTKIVASLLGQNQNKLLRRIRSTGTFRIQLSATWSELMTYSIRAPKTRFSQRLKSVTPRKYRRGKLYLRARNYPTKDIRVRST